MNWMLSKYLTVLGLGVTALLTVASPLLAEPVLERVARTGVLTAGTRTDAVPLAYQTTEGEWQGYAIELLEDVRAAVEQELGRPVVLQLESVDVGDRFQRIADGELDLACGSTSIAVNRERLVDFSLSYFVTGTQVLTQREGSISGMTLRIGVIPQTTTLFFIEDHFPIARFIEVENRAEGLLALENGRIDALASDGILLEGLRQQTTEPESYVVYPPTPLNTEAYGCILPKEDSEFRQLVNRVLVTEMQGVVAGDRPHAERFDRWFGEAGITPIDTDPLLQHFHETITTYDATYASPTDPAAIESDALIQ
ncbi:amino acid ABC transporter substrate-binding protein [Vacuolonema iberomarrocanum]|uniref:amino acid ABC transporter substrate-binding protein n=1 Tax=Vacuolonema iberomarrocanum TaxID=3454632 RepID=UPI0019FF7635|nr:amino acid ABC transporter substrate-binding protein [filamentous cyanobacterium LEGE 07170]